MRPLTRLSCSVSLLLAGAFAPRAAAQPAVAAVMNNYSFMLPGTPSYGIAQGSIFALFGSGLAPGGVLTQGFDPALERNLGGVSVKVTVNGVTTEAIPYFVSPNQLAAILPSATPAGQGTLTVTYNGRTSAPFAIQVVAGAFGFLTLAGNGFGGAAVLDASNSYILQTQAARPGQTVVFWGTGRGGDGNDETRLLSAPNPVNNAEFELYIGGKRANVVYAGRSQYPGLDQVNAVLPDGVDGCFVTVYAKLGRYVSNFVTIPVAANGRFCDTSQGASAQELERVSGMGEVNAGWLYLGRFNIHTPAYTAAGLSIPELFVTQDSATAQYLRYSPFNYSNFGGLTEPGLGQCAVNAFRADNPFSPPIVQTLDAGNVTLIAPDGVRLPLNKDARFNYAYSGSTVQGQPPPFLNGPRGTYRFEVTGGPVVGAHEIAIEAAPDSEWEWTNRGNLNAISRSQDFEVRWSGGMRGSYVLIQGVTFTFENPSLVTTLNCTENAAAGRFVIPKDALGELLPSQLITGTTRQSGQLNVTNYRIRRVFTAPGLDIGQVGFFLSYYEEAGYR